MSEPLATAHRTEPGPSLLSAAISGNLAAAKRALESHPAAVHQRDQAIDSTPLHFAAHRGYSEIVEVLLGFGADVGAREGCSGTTPLHWAAEAGHPNVVRQLLDGGSDHLARDDWYGLRPVDWTTAVVHAPGLHRDRAAARDCLRSHGSAPGIFSLVALGDERGVRSLAGRELPVLSERLGPVGEERTPLHAAVLAGHNAVVEALLELGADPGIPTSRGLTPAALALSRPKVRFSGLPKRDDLPTALLTEDWSTADARLREEPSGLAPGGHYAGLLHWVAERGFLEQTHWLLHNGADSEGESVYLCYDEWLGSLRPLHRAALKGHVAIATALIQSGADASPRGGRSGLTPLHLAAVAGHLDMVRLLVRSGADVDVRDSFHQAVPLGWARYAGHDPVIDFLEKG